MTASAPEPDRVSGRCCLVRAGDKTIVEIRLAETPADANLYDCVREHAALGVADVVVDVDGVAPSLALVRRLGRLRVATVRTWTTVHLRNDSFALRRLLYAVGMSAFFPPVDEP